MCSARDRGITKSQRTIRLNLINLCGTPVFGRDMILPIVKKINWDLLKKNKQEEINSNNRRENGNRIEHQYTPGDKVLLRKEGILRKLSAPREGPYKVSAVYDNGTVDVKKKAISERVNIRRITPYFGESDSDSDDSDAEE